MNRPDDAQPESAPRRWRESRWRHGDSPQVRGEGDAISNPGGVDGPRELSSAECLMVTSESDIEGGREEGGGRRTDGRQLEWGSRRGWGLRRRLRQRTGKTNIHRNI